MGALSVFNVKEKIITRQGAGAICPYCGGPILACCYDSNLLFFFISISRKIKTKYIIAFLKEHGKEIHIEVRGAYIDARNKALSAHFQAYIQALEKLQLDIATSSDLIGVEETDEPALIPHIAAASSSKYSYELKEIVHETVLQSAGLISVMISLGKNPYFKIFLQNVMSQHRIPCLDSYLDKLELNLVRLRMAIDELLIKLSKTFPKLQTLFLINNYDMIIAVLKEQLLLEHFSDPIKTRASEDPNANTEKPVTGAEVEPLVKDFASRGSRLKAAIELMHKDVIASFSNLSCGMDALRTAMSQLLL